MLLAYICVCESVCVRSILTTALTQITASKPEHKYSFCPLQIKPLRIRLNVLHITSDASLCLFGCSVWETSRPVRRLLGCRSPIFQSKRRTLFCRITEDSSTNTVKIKYNMGSNRANRYDQNMCVCVCVCAFTVYGSFDSEQYGIKFGSKICRVCSSPI